MTTKRPATVRQDQHLIREVTEAGAVLWCGRAQPYNPVGTVAAMPDPSRLCADCAAALEFHHDTE